MVSAWVGAVRRNVVVRMAARCSPERTFSLRSCSGVSFSTSSSTARQSLRFQMTTVSRPATSLLDMLIVCATPARVISNSGRASADSQAQIAHCAVARCVATRWHLVDRRTITQRRRY
jgi:hypothetical protein